MCEMMGRTFCEVFHVALLITVILVSSPSLAAQARAFGHDDVCTQKVMHGFSLFVGKARVKTLEEDADYSTRSESIPRYHALTHICVLGPIFNIPR